jgi:hypothetical protein
VFQEVESTAESEKPQRVKLKKGSWEEGLVGAAKGCKRMIILPPVLVVRSQLERHEQKCYLELQTVILNVKSLFTSPATPKISGLLADSSLSVDLWFELDCPVLSTLYT